MSNLTQQIHVLVVDDDRRLRDLVRRYLTNHNCIVFTAPDGQEAQIALEKLEFDIIVLDVMMPGIDGFELSKQIKYDFEGQDNRTPPPVLLLTARDDTADRIQGLESGADDYLTKPFEPRELLLRIQAIVRRVGAKAERESSFSGFGPFEFNSKKRQLMKDGKDQPIQLTETETHLLSALLEKPDEIFDRDLLCEKTGQDGNSRTIDVQINRLRQKIEDDAKKPKWLTTIRGRGYILHTH